MLAFSVDRLLIGLSFLLAATPGPLVLCGLPKRGNQYLFSYEENTYSKAIQQLIESIYPDKEPTASEQPTQPSDSQTPANASDKTQADSRYECTWAEWSDWGPKTTLFRCGHRGRTRQRKLIQGSTEHPSVCYGGAKHQTKSDCNDPVFSEQQQLFDKYFFRTIKHNGSHRRRPVELLFLVDRTNSLQPHEFGRLLKATAELTRKLELGNDSRVALATFSRNTHLDIPFTEGGSNVAEKITKIDRKTTGIANVQNALQVCRDAFEKERHHKRRRILLLLTDAKPKTDVKMKKVLDELQLQQRVEIFVVGFFEMDDLILSKISSYPKNEHTFYFETPRHVRRMASNLIK